MAAPEVTHDDDWFTGWFDAIDGATLEPIDHPEQYRAGHLAGSDYLACEAMDWSTT